MNNQTIICVFVGYTNTRLFLFDNRISCLGIYCLSLIIIMLHLLFTPLVLDQYTKLFLFCGWPLKLVGFD